jgi:hypothetical protein
VKPADNNFSSLLIILVYGIAKVILSFSPHRNLMIKKVQAILLLYPVPVLKDAGSPGNAGRAATGLFYFDQ